MRRNIFEELKKGADCEGLDYDDDIEPWLGDRAAVAAVDTGKDQPAPVLVLQVKDADKADAALAEIQKCSAGSDPSSEDTSGGWAVEGDWALIAESDDVAGQIADDAAKGTLADDSDYQKWTDEVGDAGIVNLYAAPEAGAVLADNLDGLGMFGGSDYGVCASDSTSDPSSAPTCAEGSEPGDVPGELTDALKDFKGMAATIRFDNGALELEVAGDPGSSQQALYSTDHGDDVLATLPDDTAAALGMGFGEGWFSEVMDQVAASSGGQMSAEELMTELSNQTGLDLPADAETLAGSSAALSLGGDFDPETFANSSDGSDIPVALKVKGESDEISTVLDKVRAQLGPDEASIFGSDSDGDLTAVGPNADYRSQVLEDGKLGDSKVFQDVVREAADASAILFVNFDAGDGWLVKTAEDDQEVADNLEPLAALGMSAWREDDAAHAVLRITTD